MDDHKDPDNLPIDLWSIPLDEPVLPFVPREHENDEANPHAEFLPDLDVIPPAGHHPRLWRFGEAA